MADTQCALLQKLEAQLECSFCLEYFKEPKLLPCFHVFCSPCLDKIVTSDGNSLTCPICRHVVQLSEKGVAGLQSDFHIDGLFEIKEAFDKAKESHGKQCENCEENKATGHCNDCEELLCDECQDVHKKVKKFKMHTIVTIEEFQSQATELKPSAKTASKKPLPNCAKHPASPLKIYCETCKVLICNDCTVRQHKDHNYDLVADLYQNHKQELVMSLKPVREKLNKVKEAFEAFNLKAKEIHEQRIVLETEIHQEINELHKMLDQQRAALLEELDALTQQREKKLAAQRDQLEMTEMKMSSCLEYAESALETGTEGDVLAMKAPVMDRIEQISTEFDPESLEPETEADLELVPQGKNEVKQAIEDYLQLVDSNSLSLENSKLELSSLKRPQVGIQKRLLFTAMNRKNKPLEQELEIKAEISDKNRKNLKECEVKLQQGQYSIKYTFWRREEHTLSITVNKKPLPNSPFQIKFPPMFFNRPMKPIVGLDKPRGIAVNSKGHIVALVSRGSAVAVLTPEGLRSFGSKGSGNGQLSNAYGITVDRDDNIYVAEHHNHRVQKFSSEGRFIKIVGSRGSNYLQFYHPTGITYNHNDDLLYVADEYNHRIQVLTTDFGFVRAFGKEGTKNGDLKNPTFVAFDSANNVYVTEFYNSRLQVLTPKGEFLRSFVEESASQKLCYPVAVAVDAKNMVYVSELDAKCVSVFTAQGEYVTSAKDEIDCRGLAIDKTGSLIIADNHRGCLYIASH